MSTGLGGKPDAGRPELAETSLEDTAAGSTSEAPSAAELVGATLMGRYLVTRQVGQGGMGAVYEATDTKIGKRIAVKVLLEKYAKREPLVQRLVQEARLASSCQNEHIIDFNDFGSTADGRTFVVMEYLDGESLAELLGRDHTLPEPRILRIASQAASALVAAHAKGIVHRDIKPENLFLLRRKDADFVKVVDFGISKSLRASDEAEEQPRLTQTGMVLGTPLYMSPEQARGDDELDARVDIYALGVIMYEATTGRVPFSGNNYLSVISQVLNEEPTPPRELRPELSEELEAIILRAMEKDRRERYASASELLADLTALQDDPARSAERMRGSGARKKPTSRKRASSKSPLKIAVWIALIAVVIAAVVTTVVMLVGGNEVIQERKERRQVPLVVPPDAAPPPDAALPPPEAETIEVTIKTDPPGAEIQLDGLDKGVAPLTLKLVVHDHFFDGVATLEGYDDRHFQFNTFQEKRIPTLKLKKLDPKLAPPPPPSRPVPAGKPDPAPDKLDKSGGELHGNPFSKKP